MSEPPTTRRRPVVIDLDADPPAVVDRTDEDGPAASGEEPSAEAPRREQVRVEPARKQGSDQSPAREPGATPGGQVRAGGGSLRALSSWRPDPADASFACTALALVLTVAAGAVGLVPAFGGLVLGVVAVVRAPDQRDKAPIALLAAVLALPLVLLVLPILDRW